ncbi:hypothetical protein NDU88_001238 [Pleurodeles waltl]|uniref:Uncharacterized protein n=1 Tax=Pleurodeles waltl TaxID=8319 RepID=A0AAV7UUS7_PLEWA|nr:hypothetical protein NDU88_001238 [Pleurodeles waltl]
MLGSRRTTQRNRRGTWREPTRKPQPALSEVLASCKDGAQKKELLRLDDGHKHPGKGETDEAAMTLSKSHGFRKVAWKGTGAF